MPSSRILIASQVLGSSTSSISFQNIPSTYKDLILVMSARVTSTSYVDLRVRLNNDSSTLYSNTDVYGFGSLGVASYRGSGVAFLDVQNGNQSASSTSNTFSNVQWYIPDYTASQNKPISVYSVSETNNAGDYYAKIHSGALLYRSTTAISRIDVIDFTYVSGSSFYLYGLSA